MDIKTSFPPQADIGARVLVLGSMPGERSLTEDQYYAHPRNHFWEFMAEIVGFPSELSYKQRMTELKKAGIALWDVLKHCKREGSLDSSIDRTSEVANDIPQLLTEYNNIHTICFNGKKAFSSFKKHILNQHPNMANAYTLISLPSTSPANASIPRETKLESWRKTIQEATHLNNI